MDNVVPNTRPWLLTARACGVPATSQYLDFAAIAAAQRSCPSVDIAKGTVLQLQLVEFENIRVPDYYCGLCLLLD